MSAELIGQRQPQKLWPEPFGVEKVMVVQGFGTIRLRRPRRLQGVPLTTVEDEGHGEERYGELRHMAQELSAGLRSAGCVTRHSWYHKWYAETFVSDDAVRWIGARVGDELAKQLLQELLDHGFIRRVSKRDFVGWEASEYVVRSKRRFKHTTHTLYRFDDDLSELQLHVELVKAQLDDLVEGLRRPKLFARLRVGDRVVDSLAIKGTSRPEWRSRFVFGLDDVNATNFESAVLSVQLFHETPPLLASKPIGAVTVLIATLPCAVVHPDARKPSTMPDELCRWYDVGVDTNDVGVYDADDHDDDDERSGGRRLELGLYLIRVLGDAPLESSSTTMLPPALPSKRQLSSPRGSLFRASSRFFSRSRSVSHDGLSSMIEENKPQPVALKTADRVKGGLRHWRLCAIVERCDGVRYDLAETYGLPWVMEVKVIVGSTVAVTHAVDRDRVTKGATWTTERLTLDVYANQRVDDVKLVVCQRAKYDLMTRHVGAVSVPLARVPVVERGLPDAHVMHLQRMKHGVARNNHNGTLQAALWLRDIRPLEAAPFGFEHLALLDASIVALVACVTRSIAALLLAAAVVAAPVVYLCRRQLRPARLLGGGLTWVLSRLAPLGLDLSFGAVSLSAWIDSKRLHVRADVDDFAFGNPGADNIPPSLMVPAWRRLGRSGLLVLANLARRLVGRPRASLIWRRIVECGASFLRILVDRFHFSDPPTPENDQASDIDDDWSSVVSNDSTTSVHFESRRRRSSAMFRRSPASRTSPAVRTSSVFRAAPRGSSLRSKLHVNNIRDTKPFSDVETAALSPHHTFPPRFKHANFVSAKKVVVEVSACASSVWGVARLLAMLIRKSWNVWHGSPSHMAGLRANPEFEIQCLGRLRIERFTVEHAELNFCTAYRGKRKGELNINAVVRRIADTKVAVALARARRMRDSVHVESVVCRHLSALFRPWRRAQREAAATPVLPFIVDEAAVLDEFKGWLAGRLVLRALSPDAGHWLCASVLKPLLFGIRLATRALPRLVNATFFATEPLAPMHPPSPFLRHISEASHEEDDDDKPGPAPDDFAPVWSDGLRWPNTLEATATSADLVDLDDDVENRQFKVVIKARGHRLEAPVKPGPHPRWDLTLTANVDDASTVLHVAVYDVRRVRTKLCGQWCMTLEYLVTQPRYCRHSDIRLDDDADDDNDNQDVDDLRSLDRWIVVEAKLSDAQWRPAPGRLNLRLRWSHRPDAHPSLPHQISFGYAKPLDQLRSNSDETRIRLGDVEAVRYMLASFPFRLEMVEFLVQPLRFFVKDLFLGSEGEISRLQSRSDAASPTRRVARLTSFDHHGGAAVKEQFAAIRIPRILLDGALLAPHHEPGFDLYDFLRNFVHKLAGEALRTAPIMSIVFQIIPAILANNVLWGGGNPLSDAAAASAYAVPTPTARDDDPARQRRRRQDSPRRTRSPPPPLATGDDNTHV